MTTVGRPMCQGRHQDRRTSSDHRGQALCRHCRPADGPRKGSCSPQRQRRPSTRWVKTRMGTPREVVSGNCSAPLSVPYNSLHSREVRSKSNSLAKIIFSRFDTPRSPYVCFFCRFFRCSRCLCCNFCMRISSDQSQSFFIQRYLAHTFIGNMVLKLSYTCNAYGQHLQHISDVHTFLFVSELSWLE